MIKIEMLPELDSNVKIGISHREYIWMNGQRWPVDPSDDHRIGKLEVFGAELEHFKNIGGGGVLKDERGVPDDRYRCWYTAEAATISAHMRNKVG